MRIYKLMSLSHSTGEPMEKPKPIRAHTLFIKCGSVRHFTKWGHTIIYIHSAWCSHSTGCVFLLVHEVDLMFVHWVDLFASCTYIYTEDYYWGGGLWRILGSSSGGLLSPWGRFFSSDLGGAAAGADDASQLPLLNPPPTTGHDGSWVDLHHSRSVAHSRAETLQPQL